MGNRAVIAMKTDDRSLDNMVGIYLHWNGGRDSVEAFLKATRDRGCIGNSGSYTTARLIQSITTFIGGSLSVGVDTVGRLDKDNYDNGVYVVDAETLEIIERVYHDGEEQTGHDLDEFVKEINGKVQAGETFTTQ